MRAIAELKDKIEPRCFSLDEVEVFAATNPNTHAYFNDHEAQIIYEDHRLSLAAPLQSFKAINLEIS